MSEIHFTRVLEIWRVTAMWHLVTDTEPIGFWTFEYLKHKVGISYITARDPNF